MSRKRKPNPRFAALRAKSPLDWVKLTALVSLVGYITYLSLIHAIANVAWQPNPDLALRLVPDHPLALSRKADELFAAKQDPATLIRVEEMAKQSLRGGALNPVAIRLLGYVADVRGDRERARELMLLSQKVSRRDFGTQLWLIENAVARGDKKQALYHYDIAMRTTPSSYTLLFSTLADALADPDVRAGLVPYVRRSPEWLAPFLGVANYIENPANVADVLIRAGRLPDQENYRAYSDILLGQLAAKSKFAAFRQYYSSLNGSRSDTFRTAAMNRLTVNLRHPQAGWQLADNAAIGGTFSPVNKQGGHSLLAFAGSGERGELMRKYMFLEPGSYRVTAVYEAQESAPESEIRWDLHCLSAAGNSNRWFVTSSVRGGRTAVFEDFAIDAKCKNQLLQLQVAGGSGQLGAEFTLRSVDISRHSTSKS